MQLRQQHAEDVRTRAQQLAAAGASPERLVHAAAGDPCALTTVWASFVPFLAHPVMANAARGGMEIVERTGDLGEGRRVA